MSSLSHDHGIAGALPDWDGPAERIAGSTRVWKDAWFLTLAIPFVFDYIYVLRALRIRIRRSNVTGRGSRPLVRLATDGIPVGEGKEVVTLYTADIWMLFARP